MQRLVHRETDGGFIAIAMGSEPWQRAIARDLDEREAMELARDALEDCEDRQVSPTLLSTRTAAPGETFEEFLAWHGLLGHGFAYREIVRPGSDDHVLPPRELWSNIVPTLAIAYLHRSYMVEAGARGLAIASAYRPRSKRPTSKHRLAAALDVDVLQGDGKYQTTMLRSAGLIYRDHADDLLMGAGTYQPRNAAWATRVHWDTGTTYQRPRAWQYFDDESIRPSAIGKLSGRER